MTIMHMDTDQVDELGRSMMCTATDIMDQVDTLQYAIRRIQNAWLGDRADSFVNKISDISSELGSLADRMDHLAYLTIQESQQWLEADGSNQNFLASYKKSLEYDLFDLPEDLLKLGGVGYVIGTLHSIPSRPNSIPIHGPDWLLKLIGFNPKQRIMTPKDIQKQLQGSKATLKGSVIAGVKEGIMTGYDTFNNGEYAGTSHALPDAFIDGVLKGVVTTGVAYGLGAITTVVIGTAASPIIAGAAVIGISVIGSMAIDKLGVDPLFKIWQQSDLHDKAITGATRIANNVSNYVKYQVQSSVDYVRNSFSQFFNALNPAAI